MLLEVRFSRNLKTIYRSQGKFFCLEVSLIKVRILKIRKGNIKSIKA